MKYFLKQYWRYIAMALAFATFNFFLSSCEVKAETNYNQSLNLNYSENTTSGDRVLYNDANHTQKPFANAGRGYLVGILVAYRYGTNTSFELPTLYSLNARTDSGYSTCEVSSLANDMNDSTQMKANMYGFKCDLTMGVNGLISLSANFRPTVNNAFTVESYRVTFNNNLDAQQVSYTQYIYSYMQDWVYPRLNGIQNNTLGTYQELQYIYAYLQNYIYIKLGGIESAINNQGTQAHQDAQAQKEATEDINDSINNSNTEGGQTQANDFFNNFDGGQTGSLMDLVSLPLDFLDSLNNTCSPITLTLPFINQTFELPCLRSSLTSAFGGIVSIIVLVINALLCYRLIKGFIDIIHNLKDPNNDEIEVMDL